MNADTDTSRPGWSCNSEPGLADQKDTDRLMDIESRTSDDRPSICPICGLSGENGITWRSATGTATAYYVDKADHIFSVTWVEVA